MTTRSRTIGPQQNRASIITLSEEETARVRRFVIACGAVGVAKKRLGIGDSTLEAARDFGRMQRTTRVRLLEALAREEGV